MYNYDLILFISLLRHTVYEGSWGIEYEGKGSGDERAMVLKSLALLKRVLGDE